MIRLSGTNPIARLLRLLVAVSCIVPCAALRASFAPVGSVSAPAPAPQAPLNEEDETERQVLSEVLAAESRRVRLPEQIPTATRCLARTHTANAHRQLSVRDGPRPEDPFRNGLGTPYRC